VRLRFLFCPEKLSSVVTVSKLCSHSFERHRVVAISDVLQEVAPPAASAIGVGHLLGQSYPNGITEQQALSLFRADASWTERVVCACVKVALTQGAFDALVSFMFNLGSGTFERSSVLAHLDAGAP
jgi:hypothetical protein